MNKIEIKVHSNDIFDYVIGNTNLNAIGFFLDPFRYEVRNEGIFDFVNQQIIQQSKEYEVYCDWISNLHNQVMQKRKCLSDLDVKRIQNQCDEIAKIAPKEIFI